MNGNRRPILIDTDTASDDAVALIMAFRSPLVEVVAVTTVAGNVPVEQGTRNALFSAELCGANVPVHPGASKPFLRELETAEWFHGVDGLGDHGFYPVKTEAATEPAVQAILRLVQFYPDLEIITLGPLTNLAMALLQDPVLMSRLSRLVVMGGAPCVEGNVTPAAEFNIWVDPEAARIVFRSGLPIEMVGWQLSRGSAVLHTEDITSILALNTQYADFAIRSNSTARHAYLEQTGEDGISLPDPVAMAVLLNPYLMLESSFHHVDIETGSDLTRGMTVVDRLNVATNLRNRHVWSVALERSVPVKVCWRLDVPGWEEGAV